ncbi:WD and tetratricopeptide repeats protein [Phytophthora pseudosyringae]|uniref:WD and tetratricopeptide repeats protein n=1 Tax=Phytophthora pseudosyringae TaxID=221518 RepID=A0A8T1VGY9_9STRA|nr:WD and tetratricopeptide repeats protein [Phytophthora pseudosyringae]
MEVSRAPAQPPPRPRPDRHWKYSHSPVGLSRLLQEREVRGNARVIDAACQGHGSLVRRLQCEAVLKGHEGCVNTLQWNASGQLLASGSDDHNVIVWSYEQHKQQQVIQSGHTLNIFAVCFVPGTDDHVLASGAMDNDVRIHYAPFREDSSKVFRVHRDRVKDIGSSWAVPKVFWTAAEDGLVYQFDLRALPKTGGSCESPDASGVLINLGRDRNGRVLRGMGMTAHPLDPTKVALACGDFYTRMYDRRMLRVQQHISSARSAGATTPVEVFAPPHLHLDAFCDTNAQSFHDKSHGTSIQFSSDGSEILANYHNDHIYLFKVGSNETVVFKKDNKSEPQIQPLPWLNGANMDEPFLPLDLHLEGVQMVHGQGREALEGREYARALKSLNLSCGARGVTEMTATQRKELHHDCAKAYLGRSWNADSYLAAVQCKKALELDPNDREVELTYTKALNEGKRQLQAKWQARRYKEKYPDHEADVLPFLNGTTSADRDGRAVHRTFRLYRSSDEDSSSDSDGEAPHGNQDDIPGDDLPDDDDGFWEGNLVNSMPVNCDVLRRYIGYCNVQTDIKEAAFFGKNDAYIIAGSDDGRALVWDKATGELVNAIEADADIVNCVQPHPFDACLATSGIENVIRLWSPTSGKENTPTEAELEDIITRNQSKMDDIAVSFEGSMHNMVRLVFQSGGDHQAIQECTTS